jgi:hypothetical protein
LAEQEWPGSFSRAKVEELNLRLLGDRVLIPMEAPECSRGHKPMMISEQKTLKPAAEPF